MNIFVDYCLLPVSCFRKASFLEKSIQSDQKQICRMRPCAKEVRCDRIFQPNNRRSCSVRVSVKDDKRLVTFCINSASSLLSHQLSSHLFVCLSDFHSLQNELISHTHTHTHSMSYGVGS